jgi:pimeloyl-ACP methyl ester carboxylesterase
VLLHGVAMTWTMWIPQITGLRDTFRVVALDLPGHGALADKPFDFGDAADDVAAELRERDAVPALVVGLSLGGYVAMVVATRHPDIVAGLVLAGATADPRRRLIHVLAGEVYPRLFALLPERPLVWLQNYGLRKTLARDVAEPMIAAGFSFRTAGDVYRQVAGRDFLQLVRRIDQPILVLNGTRDRTNRHDEAGFLTAARRARLELLQGAGHVANLEQPDAFTDAVRRFACTLWPCKHAGSSTDANGVGPVASG